MNRIFYFGILLALLAFPLSAWSQYTINGQIFDENNNPVFGAEIYIEQLHIGTTSDQDGGFELQGIPKGTHHVSVSYIGFTTKNLEISVSDQELKLDISLEPSIFHMDEVIVSAPFNKLQSENVMKIETKTIESLKKTGAPTLMQSISEMPGVSEISTGTGIGKPVIRGLSGNRVLVYTQGVRLENQQFGTEHGLGMNDSGLQSVEVIKGPASLLYGSDALGGVLYLNPEKFAFQNETKINLNQNFYSNTLGSNTSLGFKTSGKKFKFLVRGGFNSHEDYKISEGDKVTNTRFREKDLKTGLGLNLDKFVTEFRYNYNHSEIGIPHGIEEQTSSRLPALPNQDLKTHILSLHNHLFLGNSKIDLNLGYIQNERKEFEEEHHHEEEQEEDADHDPEEDHHDELHPALDMDLKTFSYDLKFNFAKMGRFETIAGLQGMMQDNSNFGEEILIPDARINDLGLLVTSTMTLSENNALQGGIRYDFRKLSSSSFEIEDADLTENTVIEGLDKDFANITFSLGYKSLFFDKLTTRLNLASGFRAPNLAELTSFGVHHGTNRFEVGNPDLDSEQNFQTDLSLNFANRHLEAFVNGFYNKLNNYIFANPTATEINGYRVFEYIQSDAKLYGGEFGIHLHPHPFDWLHVESNFEIVVGKQDSGAYLPLIPANKWGNTIRMELKGNDWFNDIYSAIVFDTYFDQDNVSEFETNTPGYNLIHLRLGGNFSFNKTDLSLNLSVNNLLDKRYTSHLSLLKNDMVPNPGRNIVLGLNFNLF